MPTVAGEKWLWVPKPGLCVKSLTLSFKIKSLCIIRNHFRAAVISEGSALWEEFLHSGSKLYQVQQWFQSDFIPPSQDLYLGSQYEILKDFLRLSMPMSSKLQQASAYVTWHFNTYKSRAAHLKLKLSSGETFSLCYSPRLHFQAMEK